MNQACDPYQSFIVEASAGTGKTHLLIHRYMALVAAHAPIAEIIAVTFTRKAAHEMQERILALANQLLQDKSAQASFDTALLQFYRQAKLDAQKPKSAETAAKDIIAQSQRMKVKTMDSLWQEWLTMLASYDLQRKVQHPIAILEQGEADEIKDKVWEKLWQQLRNEKLGALGAEALDELLKDETTTDVRNRVETLCKHRQNYRYTNHDEQADDTKHCATYEYLNRKGSSYAAIAERFNKLYRIHKHSKYEFNDLLNAMHDIITNNLEAQYVLEQHISHILLDEFQDTSDRQWEIFKPLCLELMAGDNLAYSKHSIRSTMFIVGDKKQSIYAFRDTSPKIMTTATNDLSPLQPQHLSLQVNYRTTSHLISFFNQVFPRLNLADYQPHIAHSTNEQSTPSSFISIAVHDKSDKNTEQLVKLEANYVAEQIQKLLNSSELQAQDISILYRNQTHSDKLAEALAARDIKHYKHQSNHLLMHQETNDMVALCRWLLLAEDMQALMTVLRSQGVSESEALGLCVNTANQQDMRSVPALRADRVLKQLKDKSLAESLVMLQQQSHLPAFRLIAQAIYRFNFIAAYPQDRAKFNIIAFLEMLTNLASKGVISLAAVCAKLDQSFEIDSHTPNDAVSLMTIHKSKGLEFPCVFLVQAGDEWAKTDSYWLRAGETIQYVGTSNNSEHKRPAKLKEQIIANKQHRTEQEELRLLYVAMTRAKSHLMISGSDKHFLAKIRRVASEISEQGGNAFAPVDNTKAKNEPKGASSNVWSSAPAFVEETHTIDSSDTSHKSLVHKSSSHAFLVHTSLVHISLVMVSKDVAVTHTCSSKNTPAPDTTHISSDALQPSDTLNSSSAINPSDTPHTSAPSLVTVSNGVDIQLFRASKKSTKPLQDKSLLDTLLGVYAHKMLEQAAHGKPYSDASYWQALLRGAGIVNSSDDLHHIIDKSIADFIKSDKWQGLFTNSLWFKTEARVSYLDADKLLNGIIDLLVCYRQNKILQNKILVVDYKLGAIKDSYTEQLNYYAAAVKRIYPNYQVKTKVISVLV